MPHKRVDEDESHDLLQVPGRTPEYQDGEALEHGSEELGDPRLLLQGYPKLLGAVFLRIFSQILQSDRVRVLQAFELRMV